MNDRQHLLFYKDDTGQRRYFAGIVEDKQTSTDNPQAARVFNSQHSAQLNAGHYSNRRQWLDAKQWQTTERPSTAPLAVTDPVMQGKVWPLGVV